MPLSALFTLLSLTLDRPKSRGSAFETDRIPTSAGALEMTFIGHGTLMFTFQGKVIHVDPYSKLADYTTLPKADLLLITHAHADHLDPEAMAAVSGENTVPVFARECAGRLKAGICMENGDTKTLLGILIEAVPAYNLIHKNEKGRLYHPKGNGNGYVMTFGDSRVYVAGDTENTPEMKALKDIHVAFLPMNLPYTMTPEMVADAAKAFRPKILYPYHFDQTDPMRLVTLLKDAGDIDVRIRKMA